MRRTPVIATPASRIAVVFVLAGLLTLALPLTVTQAGAAPSPKPECSDRIDNDGDGLADYKRGGRHGGDPDCTSRKDTSEAPTLECTDEDGDGQLDHPPALPNVHDVHCDLVTGEASIWECDTGYTDLNGVLADGCEYAVTVTGPEQCDGVDNDGDGQVDEGLALPEVPNGFIVCAQGTVVVFCNPGFTDANSDPYDGCEAREVSG